MREITQTDVDIAKQESLWDFGNSVLYDLCEKHSRHDHLDKIIAKIWLIGRSYSASIERRKKISDVGERFYESVVAPVVQRAHIDSWFSDLGTLTKPVLESCWFFD